jgi:LmbE family N-acetylglucosaminyl deacetylase
MTDVRSEPTPPKRALLIAAHPDDIEFVMAGTAAKWSRMGSQIRYVLVTSGDAGSRDPALTRPELARIREGEQRSAARVAGVDDVVFLGYPDGELVLSLDLRRALVREIRRFKPDAVLCFDPTRVFSGDRYINHPDHRAAGQAALDAVAPGAAMPNIFADLRDEGLEPHAVGEVYVAGEPNGSTFIDISDTIDLKLDALRQHASQFPDGWDPGEMVRQWAAETGEKAGVAFAEAFLRISLSHDAEEEDVRDETDKGRN